MAKHGHKTEIKGRDPFYDIYKRIKAGEAPREVRLDAARGLIAFDNLLLGKSLVILLKDKDPKIAAEADNTLKTLPKNILIAMASDSASPPALLNAIAKRHYNDGKIAEQLVLNRSTADITVAALAKRVSPKIQELIFRNQVRIQRYPQIADSLLINPKLDSHIRMNLLIYLEEQELQQETSGKLRYEAESGSSKEGVSAKEKSAEDLDKWYKKVSANEVDTDDLESQLEDALQDEGLSLDKLQDDTLEEEKERDLATAIMKLPENMREVLATKGSIMVRTVLLKDPSRRVAIAVVNSPKITEDEIIRVAKMRNIDKEVLRSIAKHKEWSKTYGVQNALVNNPKTPPDVAINLVRLLRDSDLKSIIKSRELPYSVRAAASKTLEKRSFRYKK